MSKELFQYPNVVGFGRGYKVKDGATVDRVARVVLVSEKKPIAALSADEVIPKMIDGEVTDVVHVGHVIAHQDHDEYHRPAPGGVSIGHYQITAGTLGVNVKINDMKAILSNNHVLANSNDASVGDAILQPGPYDGGTADQRIGRLSDFEPINFGTAPPVCPFAEGFAAVSNWLARLVRSSHRVQAYMENQAAVNVMDAAIAFPDVQADLSETIMGIGIPQGTTSPALGLGVIKSGRTTGVTMGEITVLEATIVVGYGGGKSATFEGQIITSNMSQPGDSGSLLLDENSLAAVGLLFAGSDQVTIHSPIGPILSRFGAVI